MKYKMIRRDEFVARRYLNYLKKKKYLDNVDPDRDFSHLTDLDKVYAPFTVPMKDIIICDACNENIDRPLFVFFEDEKCYHDQCAAQYNWYKDLTLAPPPDLLKPGTFEQPPYDLEQEGFPKNVIPLFRKKPNGHKPPGGAA